MGSTASLPRFEIFNVISSVVLELLRMLAWMKLVLTSMIKRRSVTSRAVCDFAGGFLKLQKFVLECGVIDLWRLLHEPRGLEANHEGTHGRHLLKLLSGLRSNLGERFQATALTLKSLVA